MVLVLMLAAAILLIIVDYARDHYRDQGLERIHTSVETVLFVLSGCAAVLALMTYWDSVESEKKQRQLQKRKYLEKFYRRFLQDCVVGTEAFDWPTILTREYLPLCKRALAYDKAVKRGKDPVLPPAKDRAKLRDLDAVIDGLEHLYLAVRHDTVDIESAVLYFDYYIEVVQKSYRKKKAVRKYINTYWPDTVPHLFKDIDKHKKRRPESS